MMSEDELKELESEALEELYLAVVTERERRVNLEQAPQMIKQILAQYQEAQGISYNVGDGWVQPKSLLEAYPQGQQVTYQGKMWESLVPANVWEPGVSGWREVVNSASLDSSKYPEWVQPSGAHDAYQWGDKVTRNGVVYLSQMENNVWDPETFPMGWTIYQGE